MRNPRRRWLVIGLAGFGLAAQSLVNAANSESPAAACGSTATSDRAKTSKGDQIELPRYCPPKRGAPAGRLGGATRGNGPSGVALEVLAPDHVALTLQEQPTLYWFVASPVSLRIQLTLVSDETTKPLLEVDLPPVASSGIYSFRLAEAKVRLQLDREYDWTIAAVMDPRERSKDLISSGVIKHVAGEPHAAADPASAARAYAAAGLWYDAIDAASQAVASNPTDARAHLQRAALLDQVDLTAAAEFDRSQAK